MFGNHHFVTIYSKLYFKPHFKRADVLDERSGFLFQEEKGINKSVGILDRIINSLSWCGSLFTLVDTIWVACLENKKNKVNGRGDWRWCVGNNSLITLSILVTPKKVKITLGRKLTSLRSVNFSPLGNFDYFRSYILLLVIRVYYYLPD